MNRRGFCKSLAMAPAAAVAASIGVKAAPFIPGDTHMGSRTGRWSSGYKVYPWQQSITQRYWNKVLDHKVGDTIIGADGCLYRVTSVIHDETALELIS